MRSPQSTIGVAPDASPFSAALPYPTGMGYKIRRLCADYQIQAFFHQERPIPASSAEVDAGISHVARKGSAAGTGLGGFAPRNVPSCKPPRAGTAGRGCSREGEPTLGATDAATAVAERLGAGIAKALLGKAAIPDDLPFTA